MCCLSPFLLLSRRQLAYGCSFLHTVWTCFLFQGIHLPVFRGRISRLLLADNHRFATYCYGSGGVWRVQANAFGNGENAQQIHTADNLHNGGNVFRIGYKHRAFPFHAESLQSVVGKEYNSLVFVIKGVLLTNILPEYLISMILAPHIVLGVRRGLKLGLEGNNWKHDESEKNPA